MKALLTIGHENYLLENQKDCDALLHLLRGARKVRNETLFGPRGTDKEYSREFYQTFEVVSDLPERFGISLVPDEEVVSREVFAKAKEENDRKISALAAGSAEPAEVSSRS